MIGNLDCPKCGRWFIWASFPALPEDPTARALARLCAACGGTNEYSRDAALVEIRDAAARGPYAAGGLLGPRRR